MDKDNNTTNNPINQNPYKHSGPGEPFGMVIGNLDPTLREALGLPEECASVGIVTSEKRRPDIYFGADEAIK